MRARGPRFVIEPAGSEEAALGRGGGGRGGHEDAERQENGEEREAEVEDIAPGQTAELEWTFTEPGDFQFACHLLDHYQEGMVVEIEVVE